MNLATHIPRLTALIEECPPGSLVWHRASGHKGVVVEYTLDGTGCCMLMIDYGPEAEWVKELPSCLTAKPPTRPRQTGDEWKDLTP